MSRWQGLRIETEGTGISRPLSEQVNLLGAMLGQAIREQGGPEMLELVEQLRLLCRQSAREERPAPRQEAEGKIHQLGHQEIVWLLRAYTAFFHLVNQAEKREIIRINRERARKSKAGSPRTESIEEAIGDLKKQGWTLEEVLSLIARLDIQPTLTAHPTEARRRTILYKQQRIADLLSVLQERKTTPEEEEQVLDELYDQIALLLATDEVRAERPSVQDEVEQGLYFMSKVIWETAPRIYGDIKRALQRYYGAEADPAVILRYRSWIGSDRDGNPNVTPDVTRWTATTQRRTALGLYLAELVELRRELSISERQASISQALYESLEKDAEEVSLEEDRIRPVRREPYRIKINYMIKRLEQLLAQLRDGHTDLRNACHYMCPDFIADLELIKRCLEEAGFEEIARHGRLGRLLVLARTFGFHLASLDVREHSLVHEEAVAVMLRLAGVTEDYSALAEEQRLAILGAELQNPRPLLSPDAELPERVRTTLESFEAILGVVGVEPQAIGAYIVSMTHSVSDLLEPMLLAKEVGLWRMQGGKVSCPLDFVPLFETIEDLDACEDRMEALLCHPIYREQLSARGDFQEIMLGYSDSNKDGGYWMANWALHKAQEDLGRVCRRHELDFRLFHGRGGTVGRGGGRANQAILALPPVVHNGRIRFTEQGEVISFRYALIDIARRHTEQIVNAVIQTTANTTSPRSTERSRPAEIHLMDQIATSAMKVYRGLIDDAEFWPWYTRVTPIQQISRLPIASRPVSRAAAAEVDFDSLRAIPWVFAWTQTRYNVPGWYGVGRALEATLAEDAAQLETLQAMYRTWPFFREIVDGAQREMARSRLQIAQHYARLADSGSERPFHEVIATEFRVARQMVLQVVQQHELLDNSPVIQKSISLRNPYTDVLNLLQIELIGRFRGATEAQRDALRQALFLSINGIAAAMQSTG